MTSQVAITVITPVLNGGTTIRDNLRSVQSQNYPVQHIIIDGASTDDTLGIVRACNQGSMTIVSEPDRCLFDAMNKGLSLAEGDVIGILNADDLYVNENVLAKVAALFGDPDIDCCYGDLVYVDKSDTSKVVRHWKSGIYNRRRFLWGWMPPHPTFFVRKHLYEKLGHYKLDLTYAADYELMLRYLFRYKLKVAYIPEVLVRMRIGGKANMSLRNRLAAHSSAKKAWEVNGLRPYFWTMPLKPLSKIGQYLTPILSRVHTGPTPNLDQTYDFKFHKG